jgi:hypothetical protein
MVLLGFLAGGAILLLFNYQVDRWGVYRSDSLTFVDRGPPNVFYLKSRYLLEQLDTRDCLVLGSSRVEVLDMRLFPDNCFNFNHPYGSPTKNLRILGDLVAAGKAPRIVYLGLDDASYTIAERDSQGSRPVPENLLQWMVFHARYLLRNPQWVDLDILSGRLPRIEQPWVILDPQLEQPRLRQLAEALYEDPAGQDEKLEKFRATIWGYDDAIAETLEVMRGFKALAEAAGIELRLFFNPMHYKTYLKIDHGKFLEFRQRLADILPFQDFSGLRPPVLDNRYWKETSHFSTRVGDAISACLTGQGEPLGFPCEPVDAATVDSHLRRQSLADLDWLLKSDKFLGAHFIPRTLGDFVLSDPAELRLHAQGSLLADVQYAGLDVYERGYLHAEGQDPQFRFEASCFQPDASYLLKLTLEYPERQQLHLYSPGPGGRYSARRRDRLDLTPGLHSLYVLVRGLGCGDKLRLDPMQNRGDLFLLGADLYRLGDDRNDFED